MKLLLDTHAAIWWLSGDHRLSTTIRAAIESAPEAYLSVVSLWEILIKQDRGRLELPIGFADALREDFLDLPLRSDHVAAARGLPLIHRDPFDRMLVGQAMAEGLTVVTADQAVAGYGVPTLTA